MTKELETSIRNLEESLFFQPYWYGIFFNPFFITRKAIFLAIHEFAQTIKSSASVLDVGCGIAPYRQLFKVSTYIGIDVKGGGLSDNIKQVTKYFDGINIPYPKESFNVVIATEVLEHAKFPEKLVAEMKRVLRPKGKLFITMPFVWPEHGLPFDFQRYTSLKHRELLTKIGLKIISIQPTTGVFGTCGQIISDFFLREINDSIWKSNLRYGVKFLLIRTITFLICFPTQLFFELLDILFKRKGITLDYVILAQKINAK